MKLVADLHTHTIASGHAFSTLGEMVDSAAAAGLKMIAVTDHGLRMPGGPHEYYFSQLACLPDQINGVHVLKGVEANIIDLCGGLDMPERMLKSLDLVVAGFHDGCGYPGDSVEANTRALIGAMQNPYVHIIAHPGNPAYPVDMDKVVNAARLAGKALEINNSSLCHSRPGSSPRCRHLARLAARCGTLVAINSDAHNCYSVGQCDRALSVAVEAGIQENCILNASLDGIWLFLQQQGKCLSKTS
ncbi:phosphatase [Desulfotomaculum copahuensis]|uniref:Phosphatase n=1 Tax=Desulfotomaculum copahuensis TaxID=1838280 RepID=A0A1B7LE56_9FIRM|nr:phosphatase [Desulfotomaculum copahuensis]OAT81370.1 phosphatase [Desulfotomaculum copahuensis]